MRKTVLIALALLLALGGQVYAETCTIDDVPAATLLLPYFEVDLDDPSGVTTLFSINNASVAPALAHVTLWTDLTVPSLDFDVYLTGYDVQNINVRDIFQGRLPVTAENSLDPADTISPSPASFAAPGDGDFPGGSGPCANPYSPQQLSSSFLNNHLIPLHTGGASSIYGGCGGLAYGDNIARGYITVDSTSECSLRFPSEGDIYFDTVANNNNVLWGDYFYVDSANNFAQGENLVHIEACPEPTVGQGEECPFVTGDETFYGRYVSAANDQREPLATNFATRYIENPAFDGGTDLIVWRENDSSAAAAFVCGGAPTWFPLNQNQVVAFDEAEDAEELCFTESDVSPPTGGEQTCFPAETGRYSVTDSQVPGSQSLAPPFEAGWLYLNLNKDTESLTQAWVTPIMSAEARFSVGFEAVQLDSACFQETGQDFIPPGPLADSD